jgi:hypothetical protein
MKQLYLLTRKNRKRRTRVHRGGASTFIYNGVKLIFPSDVEYNFKIFANNFRSLLTKSFFEDYNLNINTIKDLSVKYNNLISLQGLNMIKPGDILYYPPGAYKYKFGHIETILGISNENGETCISKSHPIAYDDMNSIGEITMAIVEGSVDTELVLFRYIGENANLINSTSALLSKLFIAKRGIEYGGFCSIIFKICEEKEMSTIRIERLKRAMDKLFSAKEAHAVCSGFSILMCQLAFYIHDMHDFLDYVMPFSAKQCSPEKLHLLLRRLPEFWEVRSFPEVYNNNGYKNPVASDITSIFKISRG